ncbi:MAG TPA: thiamine-phosphate kinase [Vicinamibacterales bacterium]|nr:thiamine-phosphate kinase [Vicinamibacterales bacterium]
MTTTSSNTTVAEIGEQAIIERITRRVVMPAWVEVGPGDDAAVIKPPRGLREVLTTDTLVDGVHFDQAFVPADAIGHRALAVNLSDLAAMGAQPRAVLLSLALPAGFAVAALDRLIDGFLRHASAHRATLLGGNITQTTGPLVINVTAIGAVRPRRALTRAGARPGDEIYVTGTVGDAAAGLAMLRASAAAAKVESVCAGRYLRPEPRVRAGLQLAHHGAASSCVDLSDGLADGLRQLARASGVGVEIDVGALPMSDEARAWHAAAGTDALAAALGGGDDYELLFTVRPRHRGRLRGARRRIGDLPITRIGVVTRGSDLAVRDASGCRALPLGFEHFR